MANLHRKKLIADIRPYIVLCTSPDDCDVPHHPPPPPPPSKDHSHSPLTTLMFCAVAITFSLICYIVAMKTYRCVRRARSRRISHGSTDETHEDFIDEDHETAMHHPIWLISTIGLDRSVIDSIEVFKFKTGDRLIEGTDCSICLGEFQDDEALRLLPKCSHAFHVACIDAWLRSHINCPLCRAPIIKNPSNPQSGLNSIQSVTQEEIPNGSSENLEIGEEIDANDDNLEKKSRKIAILLDDGEEMNPMRRSVSMDSFSLLDHERRHLQPLNKPNVLKKSIKGRGSSSSISVYSRGTKSSSFMSSSRNLLP